jgi:hypothetical protein
MSWPPDNSIHWSHDSSPFIYATCMSDATFALRGLIEHLKGSGWLHIVNSATCYISKSYGLPDSAARVLHFRLDNLAVYDSLLDIERR